MRAYSVHAETRIPMKKNMEQLQAVLDALEKRSDAERAVVMGDFNTLKGKDVRACIKLFSERGFITPISRSFHMEDIHNQAQARLALAARLQFELHSLQHSSSNWTVRSLAIVGSCQTLTNRFD